MPIIVGTITVVVGRYVSTARITATGSNSGTITVCAPCAGPPSTPNIDAAWNIGVCTRLTAELSKVRRIITWYAFRISARWSSSTPFGSPVVPPVYISTTGSVSSPSSGMTDGASSRSSQVIVCGTSP